MNIPIMAYQFVHMQTFGRKPDKSGVGSAFVFDEAERKPDACLHVENPAEPVIVFGESIAGLRALHDAQAEAARVVDKTGKEKRAKVTQHTLVTVVASHPHTPADVRDDPAKAAEVERWQALVTAWLQAEFGDRLVTVLRHDDEAHVHLHAYALPEGSEMRARAMHPGVVAKDAEVALAKAEGVDGKEANKRGDNAYRAAMRGWQDRYWEAVGLPCGQTRIGPARRRLSKAGHEAEKAQVEHAAAVIAAVQVARTEAAAVTQAAAEIRQTAEAHAASLAARGREFVGVAKAKAAQAMQDADAADVRRQEVERQAARVVVEAHAEVTRVQGWGARVGGLFAGVVLGLIGMSPPKVAARAEAAAAERVRGELLPKLEKALDDRAWANDQLTNAERTNAALRASVVGLAEQRNRLAGQVPVTVPVVRKPGRP